MTEDVDPGIFLVPAFKHLLPNSASRKYSTIAIAEKDRHKLTGEVFETKLLPASASRFWYRMLLCDSLCVVDEATAAFLKSSGRPDVPVQDWLMKRSVCLRISS